VNAPGAAPRGRGALRRRIYFRVALAAFAARGVAVDDVLASREFLVGAWSTVLGATAPLGAYVPWVTSFWLVTAPAGVSTGPADLSAEVFFDPALCLAGEPLLDDKALWGEVAVVPPAPVVADPVPLPTLCACAGSAMQKMAA